MSTSIKPWDATLHQTLRCHPPSNPELSPSTKWDVILHQVLRLQTLVLHPPSALREYHFNNFLQPYCAILRGSAFSSIAKSSTGCYGCTRWKVRCQQQWRFTFCKHLLLDSFVNSFAILGRQSRSVLILIITTIFLFFCFFHQCRTDFCSVTCIHSSHCNILSFTHSYPALVLHNSIWWFHIFIYPHDSVQEVLHTIKWQYWRKRNQQFLRDSKTVTLFLTACHKYSHPVCCICRVKNSKHWFTTAFLLIPRHQTKAWENVQTTTLEFPRTTVCSFFTWRKIHAQKNNSVCILFYFC